MMNSFKNSLTFILCSLFLLLSSYSIPAFSSPAPERLESAPSAKKLEKAEKFLNSKFGQWLVKKAAKKAEKKRIRREKKIEKWQAQGKTHKIKRQEKKMDGLGTWGLAIMAIGAVMLLVGLIVLLLSLGTATSGVLFALGGLGLVLGFVMLILSPVL